MTRPADIPQDVWGGAIHEAVSRLIVKHRDTPDRLAKALTVATEKAIKAGILAERERCAKVADEIGAGRSRQSSQAKSAKKRTEARDFESMAMSAIDVGYAIRKGGE